MRFGKNLIPEILSMQKNSNKKFYGRPIMTRRNSIYYKAWVNRGNLKVCNLLDAQGQFLCFEDFKCQFGVRCTFLDYAGVLAAIPKLWKSKS